MTKPLSFIQQNWSLLVFVGLLVTAFLLLRNRPTAIASLEELEATIGHGRPAIVEFYANT